MILNPLEEFVVARQLNDPSDVGTYYVRAFIRNAKTDALIATLNLDNKGSQRFTKTWVVPQDPTGMGFYITVTSFVYTDSGYSVLSTTYASEQDQLLIQDRINPYLSPVAPDISYKKIREIVQEEIAKIPKVSIPKPKEFDYHTLANGFESVISEVKGINIPKLDLSPVQGQIQALEAVIKAIDIPEVDLSPVIERVDTAISITEDLLSEAKTEATATTDTIKEFLTKDTEEIKSALSGITNTLASTQAIVISDKTQQKTAQPKPSVLKEYLNS